MHMRVKKQTRKNAADTAFKDPTLDVIGIDEIKIDSR